MKRPKLNLDELSKELEMLDAEYLRGLKGGYGEYGGYNTWEELWEAMQNGYQPPEGTYYPGGDPSGTGGDYGNDNGYGGYNNQWPGGYPPGTDGEYGDYGMGGEYGDYGGYAGYEHLTSDLIDRIQNNYSLFFSSFHDTIVKSGSDVPSGYTMGSDGEYISPQGVTTYGITYKSGDLTFIYISPHVMNLDESTSMGLIGHELIHAMHISQHADLFASDYSQFALNSEGAAYQFQRDYAESIGDNITKNKCEEYMMELETQGADTTWDCSLDDYK